MSQAQKLAVVKDEELQQDNAAEDQRTDYSRIRCLEKPPQDEWFFETTGPNGETLVYLRFQVTGLLTRRFGPFPSREVATWVLGGILDNAMEAIMEAENTVDEHTVKMRFHRRSETVTVEDWCEFKPA